jgi:signal transduction histidine kinase
MSAMAVSEQVQAPPVVAEKAMRFFAAFKLRLRDRRFWVVQAMVLSVTASHFAAEVFHFHPIHDMDAVYFIPASLYFFPVLYASLNFGKEGAIPTALWSGLLAVPNVLLWHHGAERIGEAFQLTTVIMLAAIVATRVDREIVARRQAEQSELALRMSELKYHSLFDSAGQAIIVFDGDRLVHEANEAALALAERRSLRGLSLQGLFGKEVLGSFAGRAEQERWIGQEFLYQSGTSEVWLEPLCTRLSAGDDGLTLALLKDVTARHEIQSYAREIIKAQEEERRRIARELHDVSLQGIVLLCRRLDEIEERDEGLQPGISDAILSARAMAEGIGDDLRRFSRDLRPSVLDDLGLVPALRSLIAELGERTGMQARFTLSGSEARLSSDCEVALFRICQEGLRNAERHSGATRVTVRLSVEPSAVRLSISDNGRGFAMPESTTRLAMGGRLGLAGLQERATLVGGECEVISSPGKGTRINVRLPGGCARDHHEG